MSSGQKENRSNSEYILINWKSFIICVLKVKMSFEIWKPHFLTLPSKVSQKVCIEMAIFKLETMSENIFDDNLISFEWYHTWLWTLACCAMPWVGVRASVMTNSFLDPSTTPKISSWYYQVYLIWYYYLYVKFVMWIVKQKIENKQNLFKKSHLKTI